MAGFPHSDISGSKSVCRLPEAFRRLPRLSSPLTAKASTVCASSLDHITPSNLVILWRRHSPKIRISQLRELTNFTLAWSVTSESNVQSIFLSHTQIFKERSNQRLEINIHHHHNGMLISKLSTNRSSSGGAKRDRTVDLLRARQALSQLSYGPVFLQAFPTQNWWVWADSNCRPHPYQGCALTNWATDPISSL